MKSLIRSVILPAFLLSLVAAGVGAKEMDQEHKFTLSVQPALLFVPIGIVMAEVRSTESSSIAVFGGFGAFSYERAGEDVNATVYGTGLQFRRYFLDRRESAGNEPHVGLQALWAHGEGDEEDGGIGGVFGDDVWGRGEQFMAGPFVGYKYTAPFGLTAEIQVGAQAGARYSYGGEGNTGFDDEAAWEFKWLPIANLGVGWSF